MPNDTPMMRQYTAIKEQHPDCILFFRLGDFYEMFQEDAIVASEELSLTLTTRDRGAPEEERIPMCGVPYHSAEAYIARLIEAGHNVAICEQTEDPAKAKGLVRRDVVRVITPGTLLEAGMLDETRNNFIASVYIGTEGTGVSVSDISTGEIYATQWDGRAAEQVIMTELGRYSPREVLLCPQSASLPRLISFLSDRLQCACVPQTEERFSDGAPDVVSGQWPDKTLYELGLEQRPAACRAVGGLLSYLRERACSSEAVRLTLNIYDESHFMELDLTARQNLELCETLRGDKKGSLLWVLDMTRTPMGSRMLRSFLEKPLRSPADITKRLLAVEELTNAAIARSELRGALKGLPDMERILSRILYGTAGARELRSLCSALGRIPFVLEITAPLRTAGILTLTEACNPLPEVTGTLDRALMDDPPFSIREGGFIRDGYHSEVDRLRGLMTGAKESFSRLEAEEKARTGIKSLKISYNKVFGYYIEVSKSYYSQVPPEYIRKQTLASCERYITQELKTLETEILSAGEKLNALEGELFEDLRRLVASHADQIQRTAAALATLDALLSFAEVSMQNNYCMPVVDYSDTIQIEEGRHPVVEKMLKNELFVPNGTLLDKSAPTAVITGPNMAGKSTYMRQVALIVLMAQAGCFVPAKSAHIGVCDRIFTRIGASDDLGGGRSTFMVEMTEVAEILGAASTRSLIILDEVGRGTSTFDGMSVAQAVLEHIHRKIGAKTLFATHYHELTEMEQLLPGVRNYNIAVKKRGEEIIFLRRIIPGGADDSYGVEVARLAGLPSPVITRARAILSDLENGVPARAPKGQKKEDEGLPMQISLMQSGASAIIESLRRIDPNTLTPIEALNELYRLIGEAGKMQ